MTKREVCLELERLAGLPPTIDDWRDLYETVEAYKKRCLARAVARSPHAAALLEAIRTLADVCTAPERQ